MTAQPKGFRPLSLISYPAGPAWHLAVLSGYSERLDRYSDLEFDKKTGLFLIETEIAKLGIDGYVPKEKRFIRRRGRKIEKVSALIPGYAFVAFDPDRDEWEKLAEIDGIEDIVCCGEIPLRLGRKDESLVDLLRNGEAAGGFDRTIPATTFKIGEKVEITQGPLAGLVARIKSATAKKRVKIIFDYLATMEVDPCFLAKVA